MCHPLRSIAEIEDRQQSLADLIEHAELRAELQRVLKDCPDLERLIARVHVGGCKLVLFLDLLDALDKVRPWQFIGQFSVAADNDGVFAVRGRRCCARIATVHAVQFHINHKTIHRLRRLLTSGSLFPDLAPALKFFRSAFDRATARAEGVSFRLYG